MTEQGDIEAISMEDFISENWDKFSEFQNYADQGLDNLSRKMPVELVQEIKNSGLLMMLRSMKYKMNAKLVVDTNIIVQDAFRVASGKPSSTERILSSPYLEVCAPFKIVEETKLKIREKLPKGLSLRKAQNHAKRLLSKIKLVENISNEAYCRAYSEIGENAPEDISFLALAIDSNAEGIISWDKRAFDNQNIVKRWEMKDTARIFIAYESGSFVFFASGISFDAVIQTFHDLAILIASSIKSAMEIIASFITGFIGASMEALEKIPAWAWAILVGIGIGLIIGLIVSENFRNWVGDGIANIMDIGKKIIKGIVQFAKIIGHALKTIIILIWNFLMPITVIMIILAGVVFKRIYNFIEECNKQDIGKDESPTNGG